MLDAGLAAQNMMIQVEELGLAVRPIGGMVHDDMRKVLELADNLNPVVGLVIGKRADASVLQGPAYEQEVAARVRKDLDEIVLHGKP
jgi:nitroreductase